MEADVVAKHQAMNPCCTALKEKLSKLEASRNALRQGVKIQNELIDKLQSENLSLKKAYEEGRVQADAERQEKSNESAVRVSLENEVAALKSEIHLLQQKEGSEAKDVDGEVVLLRTRVSELETELNQLEELIEKERIKADSERRKAEAEKKEASEAWKIVKAEKTKADEERRLANVERRKVEENRMQLDKLKREADEAKSKLVLEATKSEEANKKLEVERQKRIKEKKRADSEMVKAEQQKKIAEINQKKAMDEKCRADYLSQQLEEDRQKIEKLQKETEELVSLRKLVETHAKLSNKHMNSETEKVKGALQLDILEKEANETKLVSEYVKSEQNQQVNNRLKEEKQKVIREKKRADLEMKKAEELRKVAEVSRKKAITEKHRADQLAQQLEDNTRKIEELQKEILEFVPSRTLVEAPVILPDRERNSKTAELKLLRKQLKFGKKQVKHAKEVAKLERDRNNMLQQELCCLRQEFVHFMRRLDVLNNYFLHGGEGRNDLEKTGDIFNTRNLTLRRELFSEEPHQMILHCNNEPVKPSSKAVGASDCVNPTIECNAPLLPVSGVNCTQCISGIDSKLEPLVRGSNRKMLQSSAINSSTASFSDRPLMGSQERGAFSVTASTKLAEEKSFSQRKISSLSGEAINTRNTENLAVVAENSVRSPISINAVGKRAGHSKKRKRILDAVKSIEHLYSEGKNWNLRMEEKLSMLRGMLNSQMDKSLQEERHVIPNLECDRYAEQVRVHKKRKVLSEEVALQCSCISNEQQNSLGIRGIEEANICNQTLLTTSDLRQTAQGCKDGIVDSGRSCQENLESFLEVMEGDYMKLLDLDNTIDEQCYRRAIEMPLSPTLPVIEFQSGETFAIDSTKHFVDAGTYDGFSSERDNLVPSFSFDVVNVEIDSNKLKLNTSEPSHTTRVCKNNGVVDSSENVVDNENGDDDIVYDDNACAQQRWDSCAELAMPGLYSFGHQGTVTSSQSTFQLGCDEIPRCCVVFSDTKDGSSISRILSATGTCMIRCSMISQMDQVIQKIMSALLNIEDLLPKEKACVFFSVLLEKFSRMASGNIGDLLKKDSTLLLDSFAGCLSTVISDVETRQVFAELCFLGELLSLIEDFLIDRRVLVYSNATSDSLPITGSRIRILLNEVEMILSFEMAPTHHLVAGSIILASTCATMDHVGFLCEASYNIFRMQKLDTSLMLTILHIFAYVCGSKYVDLKDYSLIMTVIKSLVNVFENANLSGSYIYCLQSAGEICKEFPSCTRCPFSEDAIPMDIVVSLLLDKLRNYALSGAVCQAPMESMNSLKSESLFHNEKIKRTVQEGLFRDLSMGCIISSCANTFGMPTTQSTSVSDDNLCHFTDIISLVELVACRMSWDWTCKNIVFQMLKLWESCVLESFSIVTVVFLGKLGRLGVDAGGYEDSGVQNLKNSLSTFLCQNHSRKVGLPIQIATVNALFGLLPLDFEGLIKSNMELPAVVSQSDPADCIRKWYSTLSSEQQSVSINLLQSAVVNCCGTR